MRAGARGALHETLSQPFLPGSHTASHKAGESGICNDDVMRMMMMMDEDDDDECTGVTTHAATLLRTALDAWMFMLMLVKRR